MSLGQTSDQQLLQIAKNMHIPLKIFSSDQVPSTLSGLTNVIINVDPSTSGKGGTHWVCFHNGAEVSYFDPFGMDPPPSVLRVMKSDPSKRAIMMDQDTQKLDAQSCGYHCMWFLYQMSHGVSLGQILSHISSNTNKNEETLRKFFHA